MAVHPAEFVAWIVKLPVPGVFSVDDWDASQLTVVCIAVVFTDSVPLSTAPEGIFTWGYEWHSFLKESSRN
jgi:hypothetical protein